MLDSKPYIRHTAIVIAQFPEGWIGAAALHTLWLALLRSGGSRCSSVATAEVLQERNSASRCGSPMMRSSSSNVLRQNLMKSSR